MDSEDYSTAARLRDEGATGLPGWWVADNKDDPKGHLLRISTGFGRYVGYAYTPQDLAQAEVGVVKMALVYDSKVVHLCVLCYSTNDANSTAFQLMMSLACAGQVLYQLCGAVLHDAVLDCTTFMFQAAFAAALSLKPNQQA